MKLPGICASLLLAAFASGAAGASEDVSTSTAPEASIPFVQHGGIRNWEADRNRGVWIQDMHRDWYYAKLMGPCLGLDFATRLGFDTWPMGSFDRYSTIVVPGEGRCTVQSFVPSEGPPGRQRTAAAPASEDSG